MGDKNSDEYESYDDYINAKEKREKEAIEKKELEKLAIRYNQAKSAQLWLIPMFWLSILPITYLMSLALGFFYKEQAIISSIIYFGIIINLMVNIAIKCLSDLYGERETKKILIWCSLPTVYAAIPFLWLMTSPKTVPYFISTQENGFINNHPIMFWVYLFIIAFICVKLYRQKIENTICYGAFLGIILLATVFKPEVLDFVAKWSSIIGTGYFFLLSKTSSNGDFNYSNSGWYDSKDKQRRDEYKAKQQAEWDKQKANQAQFIENKKFGNILSATQSSTTIRIKWIDGNNVKREYSMCGILKGYSGTVVSYKHPNSDIIRWRNIATGEGGSSGCA